MIQLAALPSSARDALPPVETRLQNILAKLQGVQRGNNGQYHALCPAHDDTKPSLGIRIGDNGGIIVKCCRADPCPTGLVLSTIGYNLAYLRPDGQQLAHYPTPGRTVSATYDYRDANGELLFQVVRYEPKGFSQRRPDGAGGWIPDTNGVHKVLYRLPGLLAADPLQTVYIVEGEKSADRLSSAGFVATCSPGGAGKWRDEYAQSLRGRHVIILPDNDDAGRQHAAAIAKSIVGVVGSAKTLELPGLPDKGDVFDWFAAGGTPEQLQQLAAGAPAADVKPATIRVTSFGDFATTTFAREYIVSDVLVGGENMVVSGWAKTMKTSVTLDMMVAIGTGTKFLNHFPTIKKRVGMISGESGECTLQESLFRICDSHGVHPTDIDGIVGFELPCLGSRDGLAMLGRMIKDNGIQVLALDPLYLALMGEDTVGKNAANLFDMGPLLRAIGDQCKELNCTPIILHHNSKGSQRAKPSKNADPELADISMSGVAEWARQWILLGRRADYHFNGFHELKAIIGGSAGHAGGYCLDIEEGVADQYGGGRRWSVEVRTLHDESKLRREQEEQQENFELENALQKILVAMRKYPAGETKTFISRVADVNRNSMDLWLGILETRGEVERCKVEKPCGSGSKAHESWRITPSKELFPQSTNLPPTNG